MKLVSTPTNKDDEVCETKQREQHYQPANQCGLHERGKLFHEAPGPSRMKGDRLARLPLADVNQFPGIHA